MTPTVFRILTINPGSTSTKIAVFDNEAEVCSQTLRHDENEIGRFPNIPSQYEFRLAAILDFLSEKEIALESLSAVVGRGGVLHPIEGGTYLVNEIMLQDLRECRYNEHASNLGGILAHEIAGKRGIPAFIVDPVVVDEMAPLARLSGHPALPRISIFHALNQKAVARKAAQEMSGKYTDFNFIVAHLGGGISVAAHHAGRVIDVNQALDGDGAYSPERSGGVPSGDLARLCFSGKYTLPQIIRMIKGEGGVMAYLGTNDMRKVENLVLQGDPEATLIFEGMVYQVAKEIGAMSTVLEGRVDAILITGGIAYDKKFVELLEHRVRHIAPVRIYPGEEEMPALAQGGLRVLRGEETSKVYS